MDWIVWLIVIIVVVAVVWAVLNRNKSRAGATPPADMPQADMPQAEVPPAGPTPAAGAASAGAAAMTAPDEAQAPEPAAPPREGAAEAPEPATAPGAAAGAAPSMSVPTAEPAEAGAAENAEWETQWSETAAPADTHAGSAHHEPARGAHVAGPAEPGTTDGPPAAAGLPVHHPEYTEPHAPTLPGAESAAAEADVDPSAGTEPTGHLATDQPYGEGSAAPAADGSGPAGFTVKGNASSMTYHDETSPAYEETRAEVWFASAAHAEAAGFRPPRRTRL